MVCPVKLPGPGFEDDRSIILSVPYISCKLVVRPRSSSGMTFWPRTLQKGCAVLPEETQCPTVPLSGVAGRGRLKRNVLPFHLPFRAGTHP